MVVWVSQTLEGLGVGIEAGQSRGEGVSCLARTPGRGKAEDELGVIPGPENGRVPPAQPCLELVATRLERAKRPQFARLHVPPIGFPMSGGHQRGVLEEAVGFVELAAHREEGHPPRQRQVLRVRLRELTEQMNRPDQRRGSATIQELEKRGCRKQGRLGSHLGLSRSERGLFHTRRDRQPVGGGAGEPHRVVLSEERKREHVGLSELGREVDRITRDRV